MSAHSDVSTRTGRTVRLSPDAPEMTVDTNNNDSAPSRFRQRRPHAIGGCILECCNSQLHLSTQLPCSLDLYMHVTLAVNAVTTVRGTARWIHPFVGKSCEWSSEASELKIEPRGVYNNRKLIVQRGQDGKNFLDDAICFLTALAGFGTFPRFDTCHLLKPSACRILAFVEPIDDLGGILFCFAASAYIADVAMQNNRWCTSHCVNASISHGGSTIRQ